MDEISPILISIVVPCYNQAKFLADALNSVINQEYQFWECLIINDGSTDNTEYIAQQFCNKDQRFCYIATPNRGLSAARNTGISQSKGTYIQLLDSDDLLEKHKLSNAVNFYHSINDDKIIAYSSMRYFEDDNPSELKILGRDNFIGHIEIHKEDSLNSQKELLHARNPFVVSASLYPRNLFNQIGPFDETLKALEDWDFHIRCNKAAYKFHHIYKPASGTLIRLHGNSMMRNQQLLDDNFNLLILKHGIRDIVIDRQESFLRKGLRNITPPILIKLAKGIFK